MPSRPPFSPRQRQKQELANSLTHGLGALLSSAALALLVSEAAKSGHARSVVSAAVFGGALVLLYTFSTLLHGLPRGRAKLAFDHLDQAGIFVLIAGSYTPFTLLALRGALGWSLFGVIWGLAAAGAATVYFAKEHFEKVAAYIYLLMGWLIVGAISPLSRRLGPAGTALLFGGGLAYSLGVVFYLWRRLLYHHAIWHVFVLLGSLLHFLAVYVYVLPLCHEFLQAAP